MYNHSWHTIDSGMAIQCDKCGAYAHVMCENDFSTIEKRADCLIADDIERTGLNDM